MNAKDQLSQAPKQDRFLIIALALIMILTVGGTLILLSTSYDDKELQPWGHTQGDFVGLVERANGEDSNHTHFDAQVDYYIGLAEQGCEDLRLQRNVDFYYSITDTSRDRAIITGGILVMCPELQERAVEYGLTEKDFERFPLK